MKQMHICNPKLHTTKLNMDGGVNMDHVNVEEMKYDGGKPRLALVPSAAIKAIGEIMTYGADKYKVDGWKRVETWRYKDALMRHLVEYLDDPYSTDEESGFPHLWHMITNAAFLCELEVLDPADETVTLYADNAPILTQPRYSKEELEELKKLRRK
jgi:hypothetical protein